MTNTEYLRSYDLLPHGGQVLCALSGGRDSVYLLHRLLEWRREYGFAVFAAHFNHKLRGAESDRDEAFVRGLCEDWNVPLLVGAADVRSFAEERGVGIEEGARNLRYDFLEESLEKIGGGVIATAHHADDLAETMLMNLVRGAGTKGLCGIPPRRGSIVRPILTVTRKEIDSYMQLHGLPFVEDSTNAQDDCTRNLLRHRVMPILEQLNPSFAEHAAEAAMLLRADEAYLQSQADAFLQDHPPEKGVDCDALQTLAEPIASRVIRTVWGSGLGNVHVEQILALCHGEGLGYAHVPDAVIRRDGGRLWTDTTVEIPADVPLIGEKGETQFGEFLISWEMGIFNGEIHNSFNTFVLKCESMEGAVTAAVRRDGDRVKLAGRSGSKKLKQLFQERKLTQPQRAVNPVLRDALGITAVYGFGIAQRCAAEIGDKIMIVHVKK